MKCDYNVWCKHANMVQTGSNLERPRWELGEENGGTGWEHLVFENLLEFVHGHGFLVGVDAHGFPEGDAVLCYLFRVLLPSQWQDHCHSCEFLKWTYNQFLMVMILVQDHCPILTGWFN